MIIKKSDKNQTQEFLIRITAATIVVAFLALVTTTGIAATDLFGAAEQISGTFVGKLQTVYCDSLFPLIMIVDLIWLAITHDDKTTGRLFTAMKWAVAAFVLVKGIVWITNTITNNINFS